MTPYVIGSSAVQWEQTMGYDSVNFKRMQLNPDICQMRVLRDDSGNALFELLCEGRTVMAFQYNGLRPWELNQRRDAFSRLFEAGKKDPGMVYYSMLPTQTVPKLPDYPVWGVQSPLRETGFWACNDIRLCVKSSGTKAADILVNTETGQSIARFSISGHDCDDEEVLDAAMTLRKRMHIQHPIRIESIWGQEKLIWFHPPMLLSRS